jgi:small subunit ribosomal protein S8
MEDKMAVKNKNIVTTDPIADMLTRIRNAIMVRREEVVVPKSKMKAEIAKILVKEGYIETVEEIDEGKTLKLVFKMTDGKQKVIQGLRRISKPGLRVYSPAEDLPKVLSGLGIAIISTSKGIMTDKEAREQKLGGEVLAYVW